MIDEDDYDSESEEEENKCKICLRGFANFLYNKKDKTFCTRKASSWISIIIYYAVFATFIIGIFVSILVVMTISMNLQTNPAIAKKTILQGKKPEAFLTLFPIVEDDEPLIWYRYGSRHHKKLVKALDKVLTSNKYMPVGCTEHHPNRTMACKKCNPKKDSTCYMHDCRSGWAAFIYRRDFCFFLKINRELDYDPNLHVPKNRTPPILSEFRNKVFKEEMNTNHEIWIHCEGLHPWDRQQTWIMWQIPGLNRQWFFEGFPYTKAKKNNLKCLMGVHPEMTNEFRYGDSFACTLTCQLYIKRDFIMQTYVRLWARFNKSRRH